MEGVRINGKLAEIFRGLSEEEKKVYEDRAKVMKDEYAEKLEESSSERSHLACRSFRSPPTSRNIWLRPSQGRQA